ncbi:hypothetical protein [Oxynema aestuarii]|uniref:Uncharacterized protein n=1 Tax=Oxynema aestuarii AP17 TaxID=2064643 RepID=A0A6H1TYG4_9CYAN|nr:hypothetical protein [Oxynema aestuarii]QIZ70960.1 hypothetical protein HCG48_10480 [Oxynema aestuarii AP17]
MCVGCLFLSTLMIVSPASSQEIEPNSIPISTYNQTTPSIFARETQAAIATVLNQLPNEPEFDPIATQLNALYADLSSAQTDREAEAIVDRAVKALSAHLKTDPNAAKIKEIFFELRENHYNQQRTNLSSINLFDRGDRRGTTSANPWGWLS